MMSFTLFSPRFTYRLQFCRKWVSIEFKVRKLDPNRVCDAGGAFECELCGVCFGCAASVAKREHRGIIDAEQLAVFHVQMRTRSAIKLMPLQESVTDHGRRPPSPDSTLIAEAPGRKVSGVLGGNSVGPRGGGRVVQAANPQVS
jgi:hypothetical protein